MNRTSLLKQAAHVVPLRSQRAVCWSWLGAAALLASPLAAQPFQDDFNDGNDAGWSRFDLTAALISMGMPGPHADYAFPDDGQGGKAYRIQVFTNPSGDERLVPRAFAYRPEVYTRFQVAADFLDWNMDSGTAIGIVARIQPTTIGLGQTSGYLLNLNPADQDVDITLVTDEEPFEKGDTDAFLAPSRGPYRFVFRGTDDALVGHIYNLADARAPVASTAALDATYASGLAGLLVFDNNSPEPWTGVDVTYDNYASEELPAGSLPPEVVLLEPTHLSVARTIPAPLRASIFFFDVAVDVVQSSITFSINGVTVPNSALTITPGVTLNNGAPDQPATAAAGLTIAYTPSAAPARVTGVQTNTFSFRDSAGNTHVREWTHTYAVVPAEYALPPGSGEDPGFMVRLVQSDQETENSLWRAEKQLAEPPQLPIALETNTTALVINYTQNAVPSGDGRFDDLATFPGIDPLGNTDDIAMELLFYLELPAGTHRLGVASDDGFQLRVGRTPSDPEGVILAEKTKGTFNGTIDVVVAEAGVYPCRMVWFERGGGAHVELFAEESGGQMVLVNDTGSRFKAYRSVSVAAVVLESSATIDGGFAEAADAVIDSGARRITVPLTAGAGRYYRLIGPTALRLTSIDLEESMVVLTYE